MSNECRLHLEQCLASLLEYDIEDVVDFIDPLLSFDSKDDILEYVSGLLGRSDDQVMSFVDNIVKFQRGEQIVTTSTNDNRNSSNNDGSKNTVGDRPTRGEKKQGGDEEEKAIQRRLENEKREKQRKEDEERRRKQEMQMEQEKNLIEQMKKEQQREMDRIKRGNENTKKQNKANVKRQQTKRERGEAKSSSSKVIPIVAKQNKKEQKEAKKPTMPQRGKAKITCGCFGTVHEPLTNCLYCGRISCVKEGYGYCPYCSFLVDDATIPEGKEFDKAIMHKERLLKFDRESASRTVVFDSQADYYSNSKSNWLTKEEQLDAEMKEENRRKELHSRKFKLELDI